ncbi:hypothetical protein CYMTET_51301 [Cymbomonas tetramitiformis]|uniref:Uncharacterized protein n=1 Tax=Cymbomonas tetramitiformis TaxID=36881 RepID=A0AAE0BMJ9_9CHLO|nr:hypothetical protein CYMTET_51301 [Cymbomonas tetramitiformis]
MLPAMNSRASLKKYLAERGLAETASIEADANSMFDSVSLALFGNTDYSLPLRKLAVLHIRLSAPPDRRIFNKGLLNHAKELGLRAQRDDDDLKINRYLNTLECTYSDGQDTLLKALVKCLNTLKCYLVHDRIPKPFVYQFEAGESTSPNRTIFLTLSGKHFNTLCVAEAGADTVDQQEPKRDEEETLSLEEEDEDAVFNIQGDPYPLRELWSGVIVDDGVTVFVRKNSDGVLEKWTRLRSGREFCQGPLLSKGTARAVRRPCGGSPGGVQRTPHVLEEVMSCPRIENMVQEMRRKDQEGQLLEHMFAETKGPLDQHLCDLQGDEYLQSEVATLCPTQAAQIKPIDTDRARLENKFRRGAPGGQAILLTGSEGMGKSTIGNFIADRLTKPDEELAEGKRAKEALEAEGGEFEQAQDLKEAFQGLFEEEEGLKMWFVVHPGRVVGLVSPEVLHKDLMAQETLFGEGSKTDAQVWDETKEDTLLGFSRADDELVGIFPTGCSGNSITTVCTYAHFEKDLVDFVVRMRFKSAEAVYDVIQQLNVECLAFAEQEQREEALRGCPELVQKAACMLGMEYNDDGSASGEEELVQRFAQRDTLDHLLPRRFKDKLGSEVELRMRSASKENGLQFVKQALLLFTTGPCSHWGLLEEMRVHIPGRLDETIIDVPGFNLAKPARHAIAVSTVSKEYDNATALIFGGSRGLLHDTIDGLKSSGLLHKLLQEPHHHGALLTIFMDVFYSEPFKKLKECGKEKVGRKRVNRDPESARMKMRRDLHVTVATALKNIETKVRDAIVHARECMQGTSSSRLETCELDSLEVLAKGTLFADPECEEFWDRYSTEKLWGHILEMRARLAQRHEDHLFRELYRLIALPFFRAIDEIGQIGSLLRSPLSSPPEQGWGAAKEQKLREAERKLPSCFDEVLNPGGACEVFFNGFLQPLVEDCRYDKVMERFDSDETFTIYKAQGSRYLRAHLKEFNRNVRSVKGAESSLLLQLMLGDLHTHLSAVVSENLQQFVRERYVVPLRKDVDELLSDVFAVAEDGEVDTLMTSSEQGKAETVMTMAKQVSFNQMLESIWNDALACLEPLKLRKELRRLYYQEVKDALGGCHDGLTQSREFIKAGGTHGNVNRKRAEAMATWAHDHAGKICTSILEGIFKKLVVSEGVFPSLRQALGSLLHQTRLDWNRVLDGEKAVLQGMELPLHSQHRAFELGSRLVAAAVVNPKLWDHFQDADLTVLRDCIQRGQGIPAARAADGLPAAMHHQRAFPPLDGVASAAENQSLRSTTVKQVELGQRQAQLLQLLRDQCATNPEKAYLSVANMVELSGRQGVAAKLRAQVHRDLCALEKQKVIIKKKLKNKVWFKAASCCSLHVPLRAEDAQAEME